jgi:hypothetical protein
MFRKLTDRLVSVASAAAGWDDPQHIRALTSMGFTDDVSIRQALQATDGDVDAAAGLLLAMTSGSGTAAAPIDVDRDDDAVMRRVLQESARAEEQDRKRRARQQFRSAAAVKAGQAAAVRSSTTTTTTTTTSTSAGLAVTHPAVKLIPKLQDKTTEEQILRCADRLKTFPSAVDTLHRALTTIQNNPETASYRTVDKSQAGYQRTLAHATGAEDFLTAILFRPHGPTTLVLERHLVDPALLYLGISALEQTKLTDDYKNTKQKAVFAKTVQQLLSSSETGNDKAYLPEQQLEAQSRASYIAKLPTEPPEGTRGALMTVVLADQTLRRRFDGDDTLLDVLHWLGSQASAIPDKILTREWSLVDKNKYPLTPVHCENLQRHTIQYIGCWPSGMLEIVPSSEQWKLVGANGAGASTITDATSQGSSRGLGTLVP